MKWSVTSLVLVLAHHVILITCQDDNHAKYLILGGGIAGLSAAKHLKSKGENDYLLLEGDSRIGGRVKSVLLDTYTVETGAQWIYSETSPIAQLATRANVATNVSNFENYSFRDDSGQDVTDNADDRYDDFTDAFDAMHELSYDLEFKDKHKPDIPQRAALALGGWIPKNGVDYAIEYYDMDFTYGHPTETASTRFAYIPSLGESSSYTENVVIDQDGGLNKLIQRLRDDAFESNDSRLKLYHKITKISHDTNGISVEAENGKTYTADYVIVTFSLGVLQNEAVTFNPPLPEWKRYSIQGATFVNDIPIYVKFPAAFWDSTEYILHASERRGFYSMLQNFNKLIPGSNILQFQVSGQEAKRVSQLTDNQVKAEVMDVIGKMYPQQNVPTPQIYVPRWYTDPLQYGCYSDWAPHFLNSSHDDLSAPIGRMYFAGEAYHRLNFGYMEGAYDSGVHQVEAILACENDALKCVQHTPVYEAMGCMYPAADNYDADARADDGSCTFGKQTTSHEPHAVTSGLLLLVSFFVLSLLI